MFQLPSCLPFLSRHTFLLCSPHHNSLSGSHHHFEDLSILSLGGPVFLIPVPLQHHLPCHIYPTLYRATSFPNRLWSATACCPLFCLLSQTLIGQTYTAVSGATAVIHALHVHPQSLCNLFPCLMCFRMSRFLTPTIRDCFFHSNSSCLIRCLYPTQPPSVYYLAVCYFFFF